MKFINTSRFSAELRRRSVVTDSKRVLIARLAGSLQSGDLTELPNCGGFGRIRHFHYDQGPAWSPDPLPIVPAAASLGQLAGSMVRAQVFQIASCNWRCWYCFVDTDRLSADQRVAGFKTADELLDLYVAESDPAPVIDLSGGQPELVPEWILWMMQALERRQMTDSVYLWSDDNLSNDYHWKILSPLERAYMSQYPHYGRVGCFKGYDPVSFAYNTLAGPSEYENQFVVFTRLVEDGYDAYAYVTLTSLPDGQVASKMARFVDRLQRISPSLPLRTVPLRISAYAPTSARMRDDHAVAMAFQHEAHAAWRSELTRRFSLTELSTPVSEVRLRT